MRPPRRDELEALLSRALELRDEGRADWLSAACAAHPGAEAEVLAAIALADSLPGLLGGTASVDPLRGRCLGGRFRLLERIGAGAMGVVYVAEDLELRRKVACKVVHHGLMAPEDALARFEREAQAMAAVQHPSVVTIHDRGRTDGDQVYIVMELVDGPSLSQFLEAAEEHARVERGDDSAWIQARFGIAPRGETSYVRTVVRWIADLALGLEAVHRSGVLHRDIKPSNILVRLDGRPTLLDFGIALLDDNAHTTRTPASLGTPAYMPPETLQREGRRTPQSDVYSLAATLYHLLTLHAPYEGTPTQILTALATREPLPAVQIRPGLPRDLQALLDMGMHRKPSRRYASAAAFEADLRAFLEYRPIVARPVTQLERGLRKLVRSRAAMGALAALTLVGLGLGARSVRDHHLASRRAEHTELARHFPPNFTVVGAANREYRYDADREAVARLLDDAAEVAVEPLPTFLLRASFRQDHGDPDGAARDMRVVADFVGTPFARELSARYGAADRSKRGSASLDFAGLPAAESALDRYLLGYHVLRQGKSSKALEILGDPDVRRIPHAEELFLAFSDVDLPIRAERIRIASERFADLVRLESQIGTRTAATAHIAGRMLVAQGRYEEAARACADGILLAPRAHVLRINAGYCAFAQGQLVAAREHFDVGRDLRPNYGHIVDTLLLVEITDRRFDVAAELVRETGPKLVPASSTWVDYWSGVIATYAALDSVAVQDRVTHPRRRGTSLAQFVALSRQVGIELAQCVTRSQQVEIALAHFDHAQERVTDAEGRPTDVAYRIALALAKNDDQTLLLALLKQLAQQPESWWRQQLLLQHMPEELSPSATDALRRVIEALDTRPLAPSSR